MATKYKFRCLKCEYKVEAFKENDRSRFVTFVPMICSDCEEVKNIRTGESGDGFHFNMTQDFNCPTCHGKKLKTWENYQCPKC